MEDIQNNVKYQKIIKTAHDLFWKFGIKRVTIEEICREAGVSKMTFYRFFSNKIELAKKVIENMFNDSIKKFNEIMAEDVPFHEKAKKQILFKFEGTKEISQELIKDIYGNQIPELKKFWEIKANEVLQVVLDTYRDAQIKGWIRKDIKIEFIQYYSNKLYEIMSDEKIVALYGNIQDLIMEIINMFFYGILQHDENK